MCSILHKILWNFEIQTDHLTRRVGFVIINKKKEKKKKERKIKNLPSSEFCRSGEQQSENKRN